MEQGRLRRRRRDGGTRAMQEAGGGGCRVLTRGPGGRGATGAREACGGGKRKNVGLEEMGKTKVTGEEKDLMGNVEERR